MLKILHSNLFFLYLLSLFAHHTLFCGILKRCYIQKCSYDLNSQLWSSSLFAVAFLRLPLHCNPSSYVVEMCCCTNWENGVITHHPLWGHISANFQEISTFPQRESHISTMSQKKPTFSTSFDIRFELSSLVTT